MIENNYIELGKRAVICKGWRWMPGMRTINGRRLAVVFGTSRTAAVLCDLRDDANSDTEDLQGELPDLTDPATLGCLLALVREATTAYASLTFEPGYLHTEVENLVAALEASPSLKENP
jgi:hypothetical protein